MRARLNFDPSLFGTPQEPSLSLLYRYWFWGWLFADASQRDVFLRKEALRHNIAQRIHLLCYMRRWTFCSLLLLCTSLHPEQGMWPVWSVMSLNTGAVLALVVLFVAAMEWLLLSSFHASD